MSKASTYLRVNPFLSAANSADLFRFLFYFIWGLLDRVVPDASFAIRGLGSIIMPDLITEIDFLADLPLYRTEKPYYVFWAADDTLPQPIPSTNLELERHSNVCLTDLRGRESDYTVESHGFEIFPHTTQIPMPITDGATMGDYKRETECMLSKRFNAIAAYCYETRVKSALAAALLVASSNVSRYERTTRSRRACSIFEIRLSWRNRPLAFTLTPPRRVGR